MAENQSNSSSWIDSLVSLGTGAGKIYNSFVGDETSEETAYLRGQVDVLNKQAAEKAEEDTIKIGGVEISTSSVLWIIGGTIGILAIGVMFKKFVR